MTQNALDHEYKKTKLNPASALAMMLMRQGVKQHQLESCGIITEYGSEIGLRGKTFQVNNHTAWLDHATVFEHKLTHRRLITASPYQVYGKGLNYLSNITNAGLGVEILNKSLYGHETVDVLIYECD